MVQQRIVQISLFQSEGGTILNKSSVRKAGRGFLVVVLVLVAIRAGREPPARLPQVSSAERVSGKPHIHWAMKKYHCFRVPKIQEKEQLRCASD